MSLYTLYLENGLHADDVLRLAVQISVAALLGGIIGFEREIHGQAAGLRTHMVVAAASCLIMLVSVQMKNLFSAINDVDPSRIAAQAVTGIGFVGGAAVLKSGFSIRGLTTAACIWAACAVGLAVGIDYYSGAIVCTLVIIAIVLFLRAFELYVLQKREHRKITLFGKGIGIVDRGIERLKSLRFRINKVEVKSQGKDNRVTVTFTCSCIVGADIASLVRGLEQDDEVECVEIN